MIRLTPEEFHLLTTEGKVVVRRAFVVSQLPMFGSAIVSNPGGNDTRKVWIDEPMTKDGSFIFIPNFTPPEK